MPLYEYQCDACGHRFEIIRKFSDPPVEKCPVCGGPVHKLQSAPAIQFRGSGWYVTDYAKKDQSKETKTDAGSSDGPKDKKETTEKTDKVDKAGKADSTSSSPATESPKTSPPKDS